VMLALSAMELALVTRDQTTRTDAFITLLTAGACVGLNHIALGFGLGLALNLCLPRPPLRVGAEADGEERSAAAYRNCGRPLRGP
jgi:hypothetical protein